MNFSSEERQTLESMGSILITGPKAEACFERFSDYRVALVKADGKDIMRASMALRERRSEG